MTSPTFKISIPEPCHQSWDEMRPDGAGRHCDSCKKIVIDFTNMTDEQVKAYLISHEGSGVCGRFQNSQVERIRIVIPHYVLAEPVSSWKKYMAILLLCFGSLLFRAEVSIAQSVDHELSGHLLSALPTQSLIVPTFEWNIKIEPTTISTQIIDCAPTMGFCVMKPEEPLIPEVNAQTGSGNAGEDDSIPHVNALVGIDKNEAPRKEDGDNKMNLFLPSPMNLRRRYNGPTNF